MTLKHTIENNYLLSEEMVNLDFHCNDNFELRLYSNTSDNTYLVYVTEITEDSFELYCYEKRDIAEEKFTDILSDMID